MLLAKEGFDQVYGARPLRRAITKTVEDKLSEEILRGNIKKNEDILVTVKDDKLDFVKQ
ncbi:Negative regulator of genetic competence ClpC/MecB [bioreactor metagenome]|uniref:Negative regulator of genetic competence ClpC/MecB n=1 Tax=bioreactor metagenome TaxID=1076179 RepID=A0A645AFQ8_9ZZZZ